MTTYIAITLITEDELSEALRILGISATPDETAEDIFGYVSTKLGTDSGEE